MLLDWRKLAWLPELELERLDIAAVNLACAADLPGVNTFDVARCLRTLDGWAEKVRWTTTKEYRQFQRRPQDYHNSRPYFCALSLITVLQRDCGVRYHPDKEAVDATLETEDSFLHGAICGDGGTCASLPVLYVAVGRRLGYPLRLVFAKGKGARDNHLFARWQEGDKYFNIEASGPGLRCPADDYYRTGNFEASPQIEEQGRFLHSMSPREELAGFLCERFWCAKDAGNLRMAAEAIAWASALTPGNLYVLSTRNKALNDWDKALRERKPAEFPELLIKTCDGRRFPDSLPLKDERDILGMEATDNLLNDAELDARWWGPMRRGQFHEPRPAKAFVDFLANGRCSIRFSFSEPFRPSYRMSCSM